MPHPEPQTERNRRVVARVEFGPNPAQADVVEREPENRARGLARIATAEEVRMQGPADLTLLSALAMLKNMCPMTRSASWIASCR